jgi:hypothetical protein
MYNKLQIIFLIFIFINILLSLNDFIKQKFNKKKKQNLNIIYTISISLIISILIYIFFECNDELIIDKNIANF